MMVSPYEHERSCSSFHLLRFSSDQMCLATENPFSHWGLIKQLALFIKCMALTTQSHHITALSSHESISKGCYELFFCYLRLVFIYILILPTRKAFRSTITSIPSCKMAPIAGGM